MKKVFILLSIAALLVVFALFAAACGQTDKVVLNVYNWGEYISDGTDGSLDINAKFEKYCADNGLNVEVNYMMFDSNESMYNKIKMGAVSYDVIIPSDYMIARMISEDMLEPINYSNVPNFKNIDSAYLNPYYDPQQQYSVPYFVGFIGIIYNTQYVDEEDIGSWDLLWNEKYKGKILQFNNARDAFGTALMKNGSSLNTLNMEEWELALNELKAQKPQLQAYVMDEIYNKMETGSAWIAPYYVGDFLTMYEENEDLAFYYPEGGTNIFADAMCIPKGSENKEIAEMYINFMLEREIGIANSEFTYYASPNTLVNSDDEYMANMNDIYDGASEILSPEFPEDYRLEYYHNFDDNMLVSINSLWEQLKIDSGSGDEGSPDMGIYITCAVIVVGIAAFFTVRYIINRKRRKFY